MGLIASMLAEVNTQCPFFTAVGDEEVTHSMTTPLDHQGNSAIYFQIFPFLGPWTKLHKIAPNWAGKVFCPANPDLADILGDTDSDFVNFRF